VAAMLSQQEDYDTVSCDHHASTVECMDYLIDNGMRRIGYLSNGFLEDASNDPSFRQRRAAYDAAIAKLGEEPRVFMSKYNHAIGFEDGDRFAEWIASFGRKPPDALFVTVKPLVEFALWQMHKHGISAKTGIRIVGATESIPRSLLEIHKLKKITLVRAPFERIGELAAKRVAERIDGDDGPAHCTLLKAELLEVEGDEEAFEV
jgi:DNA-binding LacI/PurR family transcriptional regulator